MSENKSAYQRAVDTMAATPAILAAIGASATADALGRRPATEEWSVREVVEHMLYVETAIIPARVRQMLTEDNPVFGPVARPGAPGDLSATLEAWRKARATNLEFLRGLTPAQQQRTGRHAKYGQISVSEHVVEWAYHDLDHVRQIFAALQGELYGEIGVFQSLYPKPF